MAYLRYNNLNELVSDIYHGLGQEHPDIREDVVEELDTVLSKNLVAGREVAVPGGRGA